MLEFVLHSLFLVAVSTASFYAGVHLTERHHREKEAAIDYYVWHANRFRDTHYVSAVQQPVEADPQMAAPVPMPPVGTGTRFNKELLPGGPIEQRMAENGRATYLFSSPSANH